MPDPIWKHFGFSQLWPLWPACSQNWAGAYIPDLTKIVRRPGSYSAKLAQIQSGWPGQVLARCIWSESEPMCKNRQAWFWQNATSQCHRFTSALYEPTAIPSCSLVFFLVCHACISNVSFETGPWALWRNSQVYVAVRRSTDPQENWNYTFHWCKAVPTGKYLNLWWPRHHCQGQDNAL